MGKDHTVAWYCTTGKRLAFYTSMARDTTAWMQPRFMQMLENEISNAHRR